VVRRLCTPVGVPQLLALPRRTVADQLMLLAVHGASHRCGEMMRLKALPYPCHVVIIIIIIIITIFIIVVVIFITIVIISQSIQKLRTLSEPKSFIDPHSHIK